MQQIKAIVKGPYEPEDNQVLWIDTSNPDKITEKVFEGGEWKMTQPAQQDHIYIDVSIDLDSPREVLSEVGPQLLECAKAGTILNVVLRYKEDGAATLAPIVHSYLDPLNNQLTVSWIYETNVLSRTYSQE